MHLGQNNLVKKKINTCSAKVGNTENSKSKGVTYKTKVNYIYLKPCINNKEFKNKRKVFNKMAVKAYEDACMRAELFGQPKPDREEFLSKHKHLDVVEFEEVDIKTTENTAMLNDDLQHVSGGLTELNTLLNSTQTKLNRLRGVCGSVTNFFRIKLSSKDNLSYSSEPSYIGQTNYDKDYVPPKNTEIGFINEGLGPSDNEMTPRAGKLKKNSGDINAALAHLEAMEVQNTSLLCKNVDHKKNVSSQVNKLDNLLIQAERAETSLKSQNRQMRSFIR